MEPIMYYGNLLLFQPAREKFNKGDILIYFLPRMESLHEGEEITKTALTVASVNRIVLICSSFDYLNLALDIFNQQKELLKYIHKIRLLCINAVQQNIKPDRHKLIINFSIKTSSQINDNILRRWQKQIFFTKKRDTYYQ